MARLVLESGPEGQSYLLDKPLVRIGRTPDSEIRLGDTEVSREHARVFQVGEDYFLEDVGSRNGTFVDGARVSHHRLKSGEWVRVGTTHLLFEADAASDD
jgi:pSer/pThr/pTyr-binding forkhead associated (FHA) protein